MPHLDVARNISLGREPLRAPGGVIDLARALPDRAPSNSRRSGIDARSPDARCRRLGVALQQMIEIAKALVAEARVLILDEPTAAITAEETGAALPHRRPTYATGHGDHPHLASPRRRRPRRRPGDGPARWQARRHPADARDLTARELIRLMVGRELTQQFPKGSARTPGAVALKVTDLTRHGVLRRRFVRGAAWRDRRHRRARRRRPIRGGARHLRHRSDRRRRDRD